MNADPRPLGGIRVLDLTRLLPGNYATLIMAGLGADVIKVEDRKAGDYIRNYGTQVDGTSAIHRMVNRGKRSIALDLKDADDRVVFEALVGSSQILLESFRPGTLAKLGYDPDQLHLIRPELVICSISGYGSDGPLAADPGHDLNFMGWSGLLDRLGDVGDDPVVPAIPLADLLAGLMCALYTIPYLRRAERHGVGAVLDTPMIEALALLPTSLMAELLAGTPVGGRSEFKLGGGLATYSLYRVTDGHVAVVAQEPQFWSDLVEVVGLEALRDRQRDPTAQPEIRRLLGEFFATRSRQQAIDAFTGRQACVTAVNSYEEMLAQPHALARRFLDQPDVAGMPAPNLPVVADGGRLPLGRTAPSQGEQSVEIAESLGLRYRPDHKTD